MFWMVHPQPKIRVKEIQLNDLLVHSAEHLVRHYTPTGSHLKPKFYYSMERLMLALLAGAIFAVCVTPNPQKVSV